MFAQVVIDFRIRPAGSCLGHLPEIVLDESEVRVQASRRSSIHNASASSSADTSSSPPKTVNHSRSGSRPSLPSSRLPVRKSQAYSDRLALEIIAEREISEHLEERLMARCLSYFV